MFVSGLLLRCGKYFFFAFIIWFIFYYQHSSFWARWCQHAVCSVIYIYPTREAQKLDVEMQRSCCGMAHTLLHYEDAHSLMWCVVTHLYNSVYPWPYITSAPPPRPPPLLFPALPWRCLFAYAFILCMMSYGQCISSRPPAVTTQRPGWSMQRLSQDGCLTPTVWLMLRFSYQSSCCHCLHSVFFSSLQVCMSSSARPLIPAVLLFISSCETSHSPLHPNFSRPETVLIWVSNSVPERSITDAKLH